MSERTAEQHARANRPWRCWLRRHTWFLTARGRKVHRLKKQLADQPGDTYGSS